MAKHRMNTDEHELQLMRPGFAGIENELLYEPQTTLLFGDAKESLAKVLSAVKGL